MIIWGLEGYSVQNHRFANKGPKRAPEPILDQFFSKVKKKVQKRSWDQFRTLFQYFIEGRKKRSEKDSKKVRGGPVSPSFARCMMMQSDYGSRR